MALSPGAPPMPAPRRSRSWIAWLVGGCALLLVLGLILIGFGAYSLFHSLQNGAFSCLPADFPRYPSATVSSQNTFFGTGLAPGDTSRCSVVLESNDDLPTVATFYEQQLGAGVWTLTSSDPASGELRFQLSSRPQTVGVLDLLGRGQHTEIQIQLDS